MLSYRTDTGYALAVSSLYLCYRNKDSVHNFKQSYLHSDSYDFSPIFVRNNVEDIPCV